MSDIPAQVQPVAVLFLCVTSANAVRYPLSIAEALQRCDSGVRIGFVCIEEFSSSHRSALESVAEARDVHFIGYDRRELVRLVSQAEWGTLVVLGARVPDLLANAVVKHRGGKVALFQHGMMVNFLPRFSGFLRRRISKGLFYLSCLLDLGWRCARWRGVPRAIKAGVDIWLRGVRRLPETLLGHPAWLPDRVWTYGAYWAGFFERYAGIPTDRALIVGTPDLISFPPAKRVPKGTCCYVAQTFVEDARWTREKFESLWQQILQGTEAEELLVRLHPRSDRSLYPTRQTGPGVRFVESLPAGATYIGHYSSLLCVPLARGYKVVILDLPGEPVPDYIRGAADYVVNGAPELAEAIQRCKGETVARSVRLSAAYFAECTDSPFAIAANDLLHLSTRAGIVPGDEEVPA